MQRLLAFAAAATLAAGIHAQDPIQGTIQFTTVMSQPVGAPGPDIPAPPKELHDSLPKHDMPIVPIGVSTVPAPVDMPIVGVAEGMDAGGTYRVFSNPNVKPTGTSTSIIGEPDVTMPGGSNGLFTGNWHASRTQNGGSSWTAINPYTRFPASFGGFCCDQRVISDFTGVTVWLLQYVKDATGNNIQRIAVATSAANLGNDNFSHRWGISAQTFGYASGHWLDFPDVAVSDDYFYFCTNIYTRTNGYAGSVIWRATRSNVAAGGTLGIGFINSPNASRGSSFRLSRGAGDTMYAASHVSTSRIRIIKWVDGAGSFNQYERDIASWVNTLAPAPGPDGINWTSRADTRILAGYLNEDEFGFMWHVGATTNRPYNYIKLVRFNFDMSVKNERDIYSVADALMYPAAVTNAWGHIGVVCAAGGPNRYVSSATLLDDDLETFASYRIFATGNSGPGFDNRGRRAWGDYFTVSQHSLSTQYGTFYGTGMRQSGGTANSNNVPEYVHFGREAFGSSVVGLIVRSTPPSNVAITLTPNDSFGQGSASTPFYRGYAASRTYTATAPNIHVVGSTTYLFHRWATKSVATTSFRLRTVGSRSFSVNIGSIDDLAEARYLAARTLTVRSLNPSSAVGISVSPADFDGRTNGSTTFTRRYYDGVRASLTAPPSVGCNPFAFWTVDGTSRGAGVRTITVDMNGNHTAVATYRLTTLGSISILGAGCVGSNGIVPVHTITHSNGSCGPQQGSRVTYSLSRATSRTTAALIFGISRTRWGAFRLPLDLGIVGITNCRLYHDLLVSESYLTSSLGTASRIITWPVNSAAVGTHIYSSWAVMDPRVRRPTPITMSNALNLVQGGNR